MFGINCVRPYQKGPSCRNGVKPVGGGGQTAEKCLSNEPRTEGVGENVAERGQFEVVVCEIVKLRKTPLKFCNAKHDKNCSKMYGVGIRLLWSTITWLLPIPLTKWEQCSNELSQSGTLRSVIVYIAIVIICQ